MRIVHGDKVLIEKLGRNDPCPCGSQKSFQKVLHAKRPLSTARSAIIINGSNTPGLWPNGEAADFYSARCRFDSCRTHQAPRAISSADRAPRFERGGRRFESVMACQFPITSNLFKECKQNSSQNALSAGEAREFLPGALGH